MTPPVLESGPVNAFSVVDYVIFASTVAVSISIGLYYAFTGGKQRTAGEFLMGNRKLSTFPVALSILVSYVSAILVLGTPAEMYTRGTQLVLRTVGYCLACAVSSVLLVPLFYSLNITSSFEYLERRFDSKVAKLCGTIMMLIGNVFYMGLVMYSPSTALEAATGFPLIGSIVITGMVSTMYTALGGMKAVVWTDAFQAMVMMGGMLAIVIQGCIEVGGIRKVWEISQEGGRIQFFNRAILWICACYASAAAAEIFLSELYSFDPDPTQRLTFWSTVVGGMFHTLIAFGVGQTSVQRYCSLPTLKQARRSVFMNIPTLLLVNILACIVGLVVYAYYAAKQCDPLKSGAIANANQLVPFFVTDVLNYPGIPGIFLAVLFSGALSSMSSSLNAASAVTWEDILKYFFKHISETRKTLILKALVICYGGVSMLLAFLADGLGGHVLWASISFTGATSGPSLGMFLLGALFPWANAKGAVVGFFVSSGFSLWVAIGAYINRPYREYLPTSTEGCSHGNASWYMSELYNHTQYPLEPQSSFSHLTTTLAPAPDAGLTGVYRLYGLSFLWYSALGSTVTIVVGLIVSAITGFQDPSKLDGKLVIPFFDRLCCCLPARWRSGLHCGVLHKEVCPENTESPLEEVLKSDTDEFSSKTPLTEESSDTVLVKL